MMLAVLTIFQKIALVTISAAAIAVITQLIRRQWRIGVGLAWLLILAIAAVVVLWPDLTSQAARAVGIGRGADLLLYIAIPVMLAGFWMVYLRLRSLRRDLTLVVRHIALDNADREFPPPHDDHPDDRKPQ